MASEGIKEGNEEQTILHGTAGIQPGNVLLEMLNRSKVRVAAPHSIKTGP